MYEEIQIVSKDPLVLILTLSDGISEGRWEAVENFSELIAEVKKRYPTVAFQYVPFNYKTVGKNTSLIALMAIS